MLFSFEQLNNLTYATDYWLTCDLNGLTTRLHKEHLSMYINGFTALAAFPNATEFNTWRNNPVVMIEGRERYLPQISLEFTDCDLSFRDFSAYNLSLSKFYQVNLTGTNLSNCNLAGVIFEEVNFLTANLQGAELSRCNQFIKCNLIKANLKETALPALIKDAYTAHTTECYGNQCKISDCELLPGLVLSLSRRPTKKMNLVSRLDQLELLLREVDQTGIFAVVAQSLAYQEAFAGIDAYAVLLAELQQAYPAWQGRQAVAKLVAEITAELVLEKLQI